MLLHGHTYPPLPVERGGETEVRHVRGHRFVTLPAPPRQAQAVGGPPDPSLDAAVSATQCHQRARRTLEPPCAGPERGPVGPDRGQSAASAW